MSACFSQISRETILLLDNNLYIEMIETRWQTSGDHELTHQFPVVLGRYRTYHLWNSGPCLKFTDCIYFEILAHVLSLDIWESFTTGTGHICFWMSKKFIFWWEFVLANQIRLLQNFALLSLLFGINCTEIDQSHSSIISIYIISTQTSYVTQKLCTLSRFATLRAISNLPSFFFIHPVV